MTLILSVAGIHGCLQVSDRLVTVDKAGATANYDSRANKTVVYEAVNGILALSYCGSAYVERQPTDVWLASQLLGEKLDVSDGEHTAFRMYMKPRTHPNVGQTLRSLAEALSRVVRSDATLRRIGLAISVVGWLWYRRRRMARPFTAFIVPQQAGFHVIWRERLHGYQFQVSAQPGGYVNPAQLSALSATLQSLTLDSMRHALVASVREVAERDQRVGPHCMTVSIEHPFTRNRKARIVYSPAGETTTLRLGTREAHVNAAYSPWLIGPRLAMAPSAMLGGNIVDLRLGRYTVDFANTVDTTAPLGVALLVEAQKRVPPP